MEEIKVPLMVDLQVKKKLMRIYTYMLVFDFFLFLRFFGRYECDNFYGNFWIFFVGLIRWVIQRYYLKVKQYKEWSFWC